MSSQTDVTPENFVTDRSSYHRVVDALGDRVSGAPGRGQAYALCPVHDDHEPSLSVTWSVDPKKGGRTKIHCLNCGTDAYDEIVAALGLRKSDVWDTPPLRSVPKGGERVEVVSTHTYTDADGVRAFNIVRLRGGRFKYRCERFDASGSRIVARKAPALGERMLYNLPAVLGAGDRVVWVVEGEKDADNAAALGEIATTNAFGAGKWTGRYSESLAGRRVRIVADRDVKGYKHALKVAGELRGVAASVELFLPLPDFEKADLTDHLNAGHGLADLVPVLDQELLVLANGLEVQTLPRASSSAGNTDPAAKVQLPRGTAKPTPAVADDVDGVEEAEGAQILVFPARRPLKPRDRRKVVTGPQYVPYKGGIYQVRAKKEKVTDPETGQETEEWIDELTLILGCEAQIKRQFLGGLTGDEEGDKLAAGVVDRFEVEVTHPRTGERRLITVPDKAWEDGAWLRALWPDITYKSAKSARSTIADAVRAVSRDAVQVAEHVTTGWRRLPDGRRAYIHAAGAITAEGLDDSIPTRLPGPLKNYALPAPPTSPAELRAAAAHSIGLLRDPVMLPRIGLVLGGTAYRAVAGRSQFVPAFVGTPGSLKSALTIVLAQHFGGANIHREARHMVSMADKVGATLLAALEWLQLASDTVILFDDFAPDSGPLMAAVRMGQFVRAAFNIGGGRDRLTREAGMNESDVPKAIAMVTAEMTPSVQSARERMLLVPPQPREGDGALTVPDVQRLQDPVAAEGRASFMAAVLQWMAAQDEQAFTSDLRRVEAEEMQRLEEAGYGTRTAGHVSRLAAGWWVAGRVMVDGGAWTVEENAAFQRDEVGPALLAAADADMDADEIRNPAQSFVGLVRESLSAQTAHVATDDGGCPAVLDEMLTASGCGWRPQRVAASPRPDDEDADLMASGKRIGYVKMGKSPKDGKPEMRVFLLPSHALAVAEAQAQAVGMELGLTRAGVSAELVRAGIAATQTNEKGAEVRTPRRYAGGVTQPVWDLPLEALWGNDEPTTGEDGDGGQEPPAGGGGGPTVPGPDSHGPDAAPAGEPDFNRAVRLPENLPCALCGVPAALAVDGVPLHPGCEPSTAPLPLDLPGAEAPAAVMAPATVERPSEASPAPAVTDRPASPPATPEKVVRDPEPEKVTPTPAAAPESRPHGSKRRETKAEKRAKVAEKYAGVALVCEPGTAWLARPFAADHTPQEMHPPKDAGLGDLLDAAAGMRLGHWDGHDQHWASPRALGQVWILPALRKALGLPASMSNEDRKQQKKARAAIAAAGWELVGEGEGLAAPWMRIRRPEAEGRPEVLLRLVVPEWANELEDPRAMWAGKDGQLCAADVLAWRLARFAATTSTAFYWSASTTGLQLISVTRHRLTLNHREDPAIMPPPAWESNREAPMNWKRRPTSAELDRKYVVALDVNAAYLGAARQELAWGPYVNIATPSADDLRRPGYVLAEIPKWEDPMLPDPFAVIGRGNGQGEDGRDLLWLATPTFEIARDLLDWDVPIREAWLAANAMPGSYDGGRTSPGAGEPGGRAYGKIMDLWADHLSEARAELQHGTYAEDAAVARVVKDVIGHTVGALAKGSKRPDKEGTAAGDARWRPDWRHTIIAKNRWGMMRRILAAAEEGVYPLAVATDAVFYATDTPPHTDDEVAANPALSSVGIPNGFTRGTRVGNVKLQGIAPMTEEIIATLQGRTVKDEDGNPRGLAALVRAGGR